MVQDTLSLAGKVAIVTGSGRETGIGAGIALALARNGARVTINHVSDTSTPRAANVAQMIRAQGGEAIVVQADISTQEGTKKLVQETLAAFNVDHIDILGKILPPQLNNLKLTVASKQCRGWKPEGSSPS